MEKKLILFGNNSFTQLMKWYIEHDTDRIPVAVTVEREYIKETIFEGLPVIPFEDIELFYPKEDFEILICIGYNHMNDIRKKIFFMCKEKGYTVAQYIHSSVMLSDNILGEGNIILENTLLEPFARIGNCNLIWCKISIAHNCEIGNFNTIAGMASLCGFSKVDNNCFIGNGAIIRDGVEINDYVLIGASAYVAHDIVENSVVAANKGVVLPDKKSKDYL